MISSLSALVNMISSGEAYVNVHTTLKQQGEVRGTIILAELPNSVAIAVISDM